MLLRYLSGIMICLALFFSEFVFSQQIQIDRGQQMAGLWCFPLVTDEHSFLYLPNRLSLAQDESGNLQFSLIRYALNKPSEQYGGATITASTGGAILHFIVLYNTSPEQVTAAQNALRDYFDDKEVKLRGPVIFDKSNYILRSSILNPADQSQENNLMLTGRAPVLEGSRIALSFELNPKNSSILIESLKMPTSDVSVVFELIFSGLSDAYDAELLIDWSEVRKNMAFGAGGSIFFISAQVEEIFDELRRDNAIQLTTRGSDANMENLVSTVYDKLLNLMFRPVQLESVPQEQRGDLMDAISKIIEPKGGTPSVKNKLGFGLHAGYQLKEMKTEGKSVLNFNTRSTVTRYHLMNFNLGDFYAHHGHDQKYFKSFLLDDPDFQQREIAITLDGALAKEYDKLINSATVTLRKIHENGQQTIREVVIDRKTFSNSTNTLRVVYGSGGDMDRIAWLNYEYKINWQFQGGASYETEWIRESASMINLYVPYERRIVQILGETEELQRQGVRAVVVELEYPFFGEKRKQKVVVQTNDTFEGKHFELTFPSGYYAYSYSITWIMQGGSRLSKNGIDDSGLLFIDEMPGG